MNNIIEELLSGRLTSPYACLSTCGHTYTCAQVCHEDVRVRLFSTATLPAVQRGSNPLVVKGSVGQFVDHQQVLEEGGTPGGGGGGPSAGVGSWGTRAKGGRGGRAGVRSWEYQGKGGEGLQQVLGVGETPGERGLSAGVGGEGGGPQGRG